MKQGHLSRALTRSLAQLSSGTEPKYSIRKTSRYDDGRSVTEEVTFTDLEPQTDLTNATIELMIHSDRGGYSLCLQGQSGLVIADARGCERPLVDSVLDRLLLDLDAESSGTLSDVLSTAPLRPRWKFSLEALLHRVIIAASYKPFLDGHLREAVLNSILAIGDQLRARTGLQIDGDDLIGRALSLTDPYLVLSELATESGRNDQKGFMQILKGAFQGVRNPKAHSLAHDLTEQTAAQYLVFASLLARRIDDAKVIKTDSVVSHSY